jgi:hypothetical protein
MPNLARYKINEHAQKNMPGGNNAFLFSRL